MNREYQWANKLEYWDIQFRDKGRSYAKAGWYVRNLDSPYEEDFAWPTREAALAYLAEAYDAES